MSIRIRLLDRSDLKRVVAGWNACWEHDQVTESRFAEVVLDDPNYEPAGTLVALDRGKIAGFICTVARDQIVGKDGRGRPEEADFGYLKGFFVDNEYRDTDLGGRLLDESVRFVRGKSKAVLRVVLYTGRYFFPGIDVRYGEHLRFLEQRGFERFDTVNDLCVSLTDFEPLEYHREARKRIKEIGVTFTPYRRRILEHMREFVHKVNIRSWFPDDWEGGFGKGGHTLVAVRGEEIVGWAEYQPYPEQGGFGPIAVLPQQRHQGIGTCLLLESMLRMKAQGVPKATASWAATEFYQKSGWTICRQYAALEKNM